jgi:YVTN family beta-propeller protein
MFFDAANQRVYVLSHVAPTVSVIDSKDGSIVGTIDVGGQPEQMASDDRGHLYVNLLDKASIAVLDAKTLAVTGHFDLAGKGGQCPGLAMDVRNRVLFAACRNPQNMVMLQADSGKVLGVLPIGRATDGAVFVPATMEAFSPQADGTLTVVKENGPANFVVEQTVQTMPSAKTVALDTKTNRLILIGAEYMGPPPGTVRDIPPSPMVPGSFTILVVGK